MNEPTTGAQRPSAPRRPLFRRSHYLPRSPQGWFGLVAFVGLLALAQPPIVHRVVNRIDPWVLGMPFLYSWLLGVYVAMIAVLLWVQQRRL